ncbi:MAG: hypothetical protein U0R17_04375 [Acidimicrobiia bacterium]
MNQPNVPNNRTLFGSALNSTGQAATVTGSALVLAGLLGGPVGLLGIGTGLVAGGAIFSWGSKAVDAPVLQRAL